MSEKTPENRARTTENENNTYWLYIDDIRSPKYESGSWVISRSSKEAITYIQNHGCPLFISFDHDLGGDDTSMVVVKWMIEKDLDSVGLFFNRDFHFNVHSANPVGSSNIESLLTNYLTKGRN